jgi:plastocyanin
MTRLLLLMMLAAVSVATIVGPARGAPNAGATSAPTGPTTQVSIDNYAFKDPTVTIAVGTTVVWKNLDDDPHTVTAVDASFDSKGLAQGDSFAYRFTKPGEYAYYCKVHPMMRGTIIVKESSS